jgi:hypothetical protein
MKGHVKKLALDQYGSIVSAIFYSFRLGSFIFIFSVVTLKNLGLLMIICSLIVRCNHKEDTTFFLLLFSDVVLLLTCMLFQNLVPDLHPFYC